MSSIHRCFLFRALIILTLLAVCSLAARPAAAAYVIEPDIAREYVELQHRVLKHPDNAELAFEYAVCLAYVGKVEEGRAALKKVQTLDPKFVEKALPGYIDRYRRSPTDLKAAFRLGFLYYFDKKFDRSLKILDEIAQHHPPGQLNAWALAYMAVIKSERGQWKEAEELVRRALRIEPDAYGLHAALAAALKAQGNLMPALQEYLIALKDRREFEAYEKTLWNPDVSGAAKSD